MRIIRSFQVVEDKIYESDFFLDKLNNGLFFEARYYLSAFLFSSRSITFAIQASLSVVNGFEEWYQEKQEQMRNNSLARFFVRARNETQKQGLFHLNSGKSYKNERGIYVLNIFLLISSHLRTVSNI